MNNILAYVLFASMYVSPDSTDIYIKFTTIGEPKSVKILSEDLSNSSDQYLTHPITYKDGLVKLLNGKFEIDRSLGKDCHEIMEIRKYESVICQAPLNFYYITISHRHDIEGNFLRIGGKRTLLIDDKPIISQNFKSEKILDKKEQVLQFPKDKILENGDVYLCNDGGYNERRFCTPEMKVVPGERYLISFKYLVPDGNDVLFSLTPYRDGLSSYKTLESQKIILKGDHKNYYKQFNKILKVKDFNVFNMYIMIKEEEKFVQFFMRDLKVTRLGYDRGL